MTMAEQEPQPQEKIRIVVIDKTEETAEGRRSQLEGLGFEIVGKFDIESLAIQNFRSFDQFLASEPAVDAVLVYVGDEYGIGMVTGLRRLNPNIYVVSVSGDQIQNFSDKHIIADDKFDDTVKVLRDGVAERKRKGKIKVLLVDNGEYRDPEEKVDFLEENGIEVVGNFHPKSPDLDSFLMSGVGFDVLLIHAYQWEGRRKLVRKVRGDNPNVYVVTYSGGGKQQTYGDTHVKSDWFGVILSRINSGVEMKRKETEKRGEVEEVSLRRQAAMRDLG